MNIGIVCYPTFGGSGVVATELGKALAMKGHKVHFISYSQPARLDFFSQNIFFHEVGVSSYPLFEYPPYETALTGKLIDIAKFEKLDIVHVHYAIPHAAAAVFAKQILALEGINLPVVTTLHGTDITLIGKDPTYEPVVSYSINQSDGVTAVSESLRQQTFENFKITNDIEVIYNFIDFEKFSKKPRDYFKKAIAPYGEFLIAHTSNFRKVKRVGDVLQVFKKISEKLPAKLLLIGDGPERINIEKECRELELCGDKVVFLGKLEPIEEILSVCDLFILPSESESFGLAALEAMACEVPVISSNTGGLPELNIHGVTGFTSNVGDVDDMAANALKILQLPEVHQQFKKAAFEQSKNFGLDVIMPQYELLYEKVIEKHLAKVS
ncbi:MAG: N-acetyl-alpha-D-glucosaminyl L-malate synthase BshA [Bacteroidetes bacterium]|nr:MAG: N-acetyl-alpha-D-glucosaminyl L-malate synthase BshA [Bacteroidota bacterium]